MQVLTSALARLGDFYVSLLYVSLLREIKTLATKYYVVWKGRETGIFTTWAQCQAQVDKFAGARFKSFPTLEKRVTVLR